MKPELRFSEFDGDWEELRIGQLAEIVRGSSPRPISDPKWFDSKSEIGWLRISDVTKQNGRITNLEQRISVDGQNKTRVLYSEHLLLSIAATVGKPVINYVKTGVHDGSLIFLNPLFDIEYMFQWLDAFRPKWKKYGQPGSQVNLNSELVRSQKIVIPDTVEQKRIGEFFSKLDQQIELEEQKLEKLEEQKKGYMQKLFSQELRFKDENGDDYPEWMETNIRNTFDNKGGTALEKEFDNNGTHKVISIGSYSMNSTYNEQNLRINKNEFTEKYLLNEGDLAMVLNDKTKEGNIIGRSIYIDEDDKYIYNQRTERLIPVTGNNHKFLWYLMNSEQFRKKIKQMMQGATQVYINYNSIKDLSIYLPILEEQNKISNFFTKFDERIENQNQKIDGLKNRKKGFLQKMFV